MAVDEVRRNIRWAAPNTPERARLTREAQEKVDQACIGLMMSAPFFGTLVAYLDRQYCWPEEWDQDYFVPMTAATDGKKIIFNPMFALALTHDQLCWLMCHEVMHPALGHLARLYDRDHDIWNQATDFTINNTIDEFVKSTKSQAKKWEFIKGGLLNHEYDKYSADAIYDLLIKQQRMGKKLQQQHSQCAACNGSGKQQQGSGDGQQQSKQGQQGSGDGQQQSKQGQQGSGDGQQQSKQGQQGSGGQDQGQNGQGQGEEGGGDQQKPKCSKCGGTGQNNQPRTREQAEKDIQSGQTRMMPNKSESQDPAERAKQERMWQERLTAAAQAARMQGTMPAGIERLVDEILKPVVDWRIVLQRFVRDCSKDDYRWNRPNKNYIAQGIFIPGLYSEKLGEVVCIIDDSGSCQAEIPQFISEAVGIFEIFPGTKMHLISCDTEPTYVLCWEAGQDEPAFEPNVKVVGGGGTSFVKPFDMIQEMALEPRCIIYLTDLDGEIPKTDRDPRVPVLWVVNNDRHKQEELEFGELCVCSALNISGY